MQEGKKGVERLLRALSNEINDENINILAWLLHYHIPTLKDDIEAIKMVKVEEKE
jgi:hypothetical protein